MWILTYVNLFSSSVNIVNYNYNSKTTSKIALFSSTQLYFTCDYRMISHPEIKDPWQSQAL